MAYSNYLSLPHLAFDKNLTSPTKRYQPLLTPLHQLAVIEVKGPDSERLLQGQLTCDLTKLDDSNWLFGCHCTAKGRIISNFSIFKKSDSYYLVVSRDLAQKQQQALSKYAVFFKAEITLVEYECIGLSGNGIEKKLTELTETELLGFFKLLTDKESILHNTKLSLLRLSGSCPRFYLCGSSESITQAWRALEKLIPCNGYEHWNLLEIESAYPRVNNNSSELYSPHELNFIDDLSFDKGCYTGQEIIARMHYLGKCKYSLAKLTTQSPIKIKEGTTISSSEKSKVGKVIYSQPAEGCTYLLAICKTTELDNLLRLDSLPKEILSPL